MLAFLARSGLLAVIAPILEVFLKSLGATFVANQAAKRADQNAQDLGAARAGLEVNRGTIAAQQAELEAQANAPQSADDAIGRLEDGSA